MKRNVEMAKPGNNIPRPRGQQKKQLNPRPPQDQGTALNRACARSNDPNYKGEQERIEL